MALRLYDTARREVVPFEPPHTVRMYVCGITPYDSTHLGHAAHVPHLRPADPPARGARSRGAHGAQHHRRRRLDPAQGARARRARTSSSPRPRPRASTATWPRSRCARRSPSRARPSRSPRIIELVGRLLDSGHAYLSGGIGLLRRVDLPRLRQALALPRRPHGASSRGRAAAIPTIRTAARPLDFVLWQPSLRRRARVARAVRRRPARLAHRVLGDGRCTSTARPSTCTAAAPISSSRTTSARSRRASRSPASRSSRHWLHSAMVNYEGEKMSKSLGNLVFVSDLLKIADPRAIRLALMRHHYRSGFEWYDTDLDEGVALLHRLLAAAERPTGPDPRAVRAARARRDRRRPRRAARARRARRPRERDPLRRRRPDARRSCCASSAGCSASTSSARSRSARG